MSWERNCSYASVFTFQKDPCFEIFNCSKSHVGKYDDFLGVSASDYAGCSHSAWF